MAEEKKLGVTHDRIYGKNGTYTITGNYWENKHDKNRTSTLQGKSNTGETVLIFRIDMTENMYHPADIPFSVLNDSKYRKKNLTLNCNGGEYDIDLYEGFARSLFKYIAMYKSLGAYYPNCSVPYLNCILDIAEQKPCIYIITKYMVCEPIEYFQDKNWIMREILKGLAFFHSHGFVYKYLSKNSVFVTQDKTVIFGFSREHWIDPLFTDGLISQANFKSDIFSLGMSFTDDLFPIMDLGMTLEQYLHSYQSFESELMEHYENDAFLGHLISRMTCYFAEARPTAEQALYMLQDNTYIVDGLPTVEDYVQYLRDTQQYLEENKYCVPLNNPTIRDLARLNYVGMYKLAISRKDEQARDLILNSPFAENLHKSLALEEHFGREEKYFDKNLLYDIGEFIPLGIEEEKVQQIPGYDSEDEDENMNEEGLDEDPHNGNESDNEGVSVSDEGE